MPNSVHFVNRQEGIGRVGLVHLGAGQYRSCCWLLDASQRAAIVGGWIYLHETKQEPSAFGGRIVRTENGFREEAANQHGIAIVFDVAAEAMGQAWRGAAHGMAYWSGLVEPTLPHEH